MAYISVEVDVELDEFEDCELIDELESRGWYVSEDDLDLTREEKDAVINLLSRAMVRLGSIEHKIYEKLRKK